MSETNNNTSSEAAKPVFDIEIEHKLKFPTLASSKITSTDELCGWANRLFGEIFADYDGSVVKYNQSTGRLYLSLFFNQIDAAIAEGEYRAFEPADGSNKSNNNSGLKRIQALERTVINGNKYVITDTAKSALAKFIAKDNRGEINWSALNLITQNFEPAGYYGQGKTQNVINLIDPRAVLREIFGTKVNTYIGNDENDTPVFEEHTADYEIIVIRALGPVFATQLNNNPSPEEGPFQIDIRQIDQEQLIESQKRLGITNTFGKRIIRERV